MSDLYKDGKDNIFVYNIVAQGCIQGSMRIFSFSFGNEIEFKIVSRVSF